MRVPTVLAVSSRWHRMRHAMAEGLLRRIVMPAWVWLDRVMRNSAKDASAQHDKARIRLEVCKRCPAYTALMTCEECGCFMPAKVQMDAATCPQRRW